MRLALVGVVWPIKLSDTTADTLVTCGPGAIDRENELSGVDVTIGTTYVLVPNGRSSYIVNIESQNGSPELHPKYGGRGCPSENMGGPAIVSTANMSDVVVDVG